MQIFLKITIIILFVLLICLAGVLLFFYNQAPKDLSKITDIQIMLLLSKNSDAKEYMQNHPDFKIKDKAVLTKESILAGQNGQNFKEVYQGLGLENNRYLKVDLINGSGSNGLVAVLDFKTGQTLKAYGIIFLQASVK